MRSKQKGFSLIELLIVVAIILIIAAIAIPNLLRSKMAANEASAVGSLRTLNTSCVTFSTTYGGFPSTLSQLGGEGSGSAPSSSSAQLIDNVLQTGTKTGYNFTFSPGGADASGNIDYYAITANPITPGTTGLRYFYTDQSGVIRAETAGTASSADSPIS
jgi:prepilin-type N-terminal cleavage/methylation domain-containing protein